MDNITTKAPTALRTIGEVANMLGVPQHVLRFWETKFPTLTPQKRRGRRYYHHADIDQLKLIKTLLYNDGYTIRGVQQHLSKLTTPPTPIPTPIASTNLDSTENQDIEQPDLSALNDILEKLIDARNELKALLED